MDMQKERAEFESVFPCSVGTNLNEHGHYESQINQQDAMIQNISWVVWQAAKASAVPKGRTDFEIIEQTIAIVDLLADSNRFQRDKSKPFPFESENPRNIEWWRVACQIQELLTDTDPNNCDFEEYKAMIEAQEQGHD